MAGGASHEDDEIVGINVTPLVDVMMVLLIIFMVTANVINQKAITVQLPKAGSGEDLKQAKNLVFNIAKGGAVYLDGLAFNLRDLPQRIKTERLAHQNLQALVGADRDVPYQAVISVVDQLRSNGISDFALTVQP